MSGGVDSSVAAARLLDAGFDVVGVTLHLWDYPEAEACSARGRCCAPEDQYDAHRTADVLGFPHYSFDRRELFAREVVAPFVDAYLAGETPSPCATCNRLVKLRELFALAGRLGAEHVATGHYARVVRDAEGRSWLARGRDHSKDQSYFLYATPEPDLARLLLPVGESTKTEVRAEAAARGLPGAGKGESQELCFIGARPHAYVDFVEARGEGRLRPGVLVDTEGRELGRHGGVHRFTIGQRKGLGVAEGKPVYVTAVDAGTGRVVLGEADTLGCNSARLDEVILGPGVQLPRRADVRVRYRHEAAPARIEPAGPESPREATVYFGSPVRAVTRGQVAVFYDGDRVIGGGRLVGTATG
jgi:tRNA-specific 2-thiouridylase